MFLLLFGEINLFWVHPLLSSASLNVHPGLRTDDNSEGVVRDDIAFFLGRVACFFGSPVIHGATLAIILQGGTRCGR